MTSRERNLGRASNRESDLLRAFGSKRNLITLSLMTFGDLNPVCAPCLSLRRLAVCRCIAVLADATALGQLWTNFERAGLRALRARLMVLSAAEAASISSGCDQPVPAGAAVAFELQGEEPAATLQRLRTHLEGEGSLSRGSLAVSSSEHEGRLRDAFFAEDPSHRLEAAKESTVRLEECSCVVILPTAVAKGMAGQILSDLLEAIAKPASAASGPGGSAMGASASGHTLSGGSGRSADAAGAPLQVSALSMVDLNRRCAEEFLDVYKLVVPDFGVGSLASRTCTPPNCIAELFRLSVRTRPSNDPSL